VTERWLSVAEVSEHLGVAPDTIYRWIAAGRMPANRIGRQWRFSLSDVDQWVRSQTAKASDVRRDEECAATER
jgi:excisionase family DNA binding protein